MTCPNCGAEANGNFCEYCGSEIKREQPQVINITNNYYDNQNNTTANNPNFNQPNPNFNQQSNHQQNFDRMFNNQQTVIVRKSKSTAGILGIVLGCLGVHNFYLGFIKKGVIQLILTCIGLGFISFIWGLIEGIVILASPAPIDAKGIPLK